MKRLALLGLLLSVLGCRALPKQDGATLAILFELERKLPGAGISYVRAGLVHAQWTGPGPIFIHVLALDTRRGDLYLKPILAKGRLDGAPDSWENIDVMARRSGALAAISADYPSGPVNVSGFTVIDGEIHLAPNPPVRAGVLVSREGQVSLGIYDPMLLESETYYQAIGAGPVLMRQGRFKWEVDESGNLNGEKMPFLASVLKEPQARGLACLLADRRTLYLIHGEDRPADLSGMDPDRIEKLLTQLNCSDAILLAGGRYAAMSLSGRVQGNSLGRTYPVGNALGIFIRKPVQKSVK